jgi:hypothetical protein
MAILPAAAVPAATHNAVSVYIVARHNNESRFRANVLGHDTPLKSTLGRFRSCCLAVLVLCNSCATGKRSAYY